MKTWRYLITKSQAAMVATEAEPLFAKEAETRRKATQGRPSKEKEKLVEKVQPVNRMENKAATQAGKSLSVNQKYVHEAKKLKAEHPTIAEQVKQGLDPLTTWNPSDLCTSSHPEIVQPRAIL